MYVSEISILLASFVFAVCVAADGPKHGKRVVCYMASWGIYLAGRGRFDIRDADPAMPYCTHLVYLFSLLDETTYDIKVMSGPRDIDQSGYAQSVALKIRHPHLKVMTGLGGWNAGSVVFSKMAKTKGLRTSFIKSAVEFLKTHKLDGIDFNWQFPGDRGGDPTDITNFVSLIKEIREEFDKYGFIISVALSSFPFRIQLGVNGFGLAQHAHFLNVLSYEYHGFWNQKVGAGAPISSDDEYNLETTYDLYESMGVPTDKINMGISAYGVTFLLDAPLKNTSQLVGARAKETTFKGPYNDPGGFIAYNELCIDNKTGIWSQFWDSKAQMPYAIHLEQVASCESIESIMIKARYALERNLGGIIFYGLEKDDFRGDCSRDKYPLLKAITKTLMQFSEEGMKDLIELMSRKTSDFFWNDMQDVSSKIDIRVQ